MRILHFADLHIGHETYGKIDPSSGLSTRLLDFLNSFDGIVKYVFKEKLDLVIFAGDAYKTRDPNPTYQREFSKRIKKIASKVPLVLITGNHDIPPSFGKADTLEIFPTLEVPNVHVFSKPCLEEINNVQILAIPWIPRSLLLKEEERKKSIEQIRDIISRKISQAFEELLSKVNSQKPCIAVIHQSVSGAMFAQNQDVYVGNDPILPVSILANHKLSYVALGHIHKFQVLNEEPPVIYSGSLERIDFGEENEKKGFVVVDIEKGRKTKWKFVPSEARKFKTINIEIPEGDDSPNDYIKKTIQKSNIDNAIVRISIFGRESQLSRISDEDLKEATKSAYFLASVSKKSEKETTKIEMTAEELSPAQWLSKYLENKKFSKEDKKTLQEAAIKLMEEVG